MRGDLGAIAEDTARLVHMHSMADLVDYAPPVAFRRLRYKVNFKLSTKKATLTLEGADGIVEGSPTVNPAFNSTTSVRGTFRLDLHDGIYLVTHRLGDGEKICESTGETNMPRLYTVQARTGETIRYTNGTSPASGAYQKNIDQFMYQGAVMNSGGPDTVPSMIVDGGKDGYLAVEIATDSIVNSGNWEFDVYGEFLIAKFG